MKPIIVKNDIKLKYVFHGVEHLGGSEPLDSDVYDIEGLKWEFYIWGDWGPIDHVSLDYSQKNKNWADGRWFAETKGTMKISKKSNRVREEYIREFEHFYETHESQKDIQVFSEPNDKRKNYIQKDGSMEIEFVFDLKYYDLSIEIPNYTDVTLIVAAEKFYLNKEFLSRLDYFNALFNTKKRPETMFEIEKAKTDEFRYFLNLLSSADFKFEMMRHVDICLFLAKKYGSKMVFEKCENYLFNRDDARNHPDYIFKKADEFDLERVLNKFLGFMSERDIKKMKESEDFQNFKDSTKQKIAKKLAKNTYSRI